MTRARWFLGSLALCALIQGNAYAQINSPGARTLFARNFLYRSDWRLTRLSNLLNDGDEVPDPLDRDVSVLVWRNTFVYGLPHSFMMAGELPVVTRSASRTLAGERSSSRDTGLADPMFLLQYDGLYRANRPGGFTRLAGFVGVRPPWGQRPFSTGATDFVSGFVFSHATSRWWLNSDIQWIATREAKGFEAGDVLQIDASLMYRLLTYPEHNDLFLVLELNSISEGQDVSNGVEIDDTGGNLVFVSPGLEIFLLRNLALEFSAQIPVHQDPNGTQLGRGWVFVSGFRFLY